MSDEPELTVTIEVLRRKEHLNHCGTGVHDFCKRHGIDIKQFRRDRGGVPLSVMRATGNPFAIAACEYVEELAKNGR